eukprot:TRINITY_DN8646_c0_g1_i1.p1 TRINITY_DN8646_c0_g1~~TRINITY_DN8646_c0_g1_i1.p1  ORF type:complete len:259 (-),score=51.56 TRINITY_DN8646_c0_g1_i1:73-798(-)
MADERVRVSIACKYCRESHTKCDEGRPCKRCKRKGITDCRDAERNRSKKKKEKKMEEVMPGFAQQYQNMRFVPDSRMMYFNPNNMPVHQWNAQQQQVPITAEGVMEHLLIQNLISKSLARERVSALERYDVSPDPSVERLSPFDRLAPVDQFVSTERHTIDSLTKDNYSLDNISPLTSQIPDKYDAPPSPGLERKRKADLISTLENCSATILSSEPINLSSLTSTPNNDFVWEKVKKKRRV